LPTEYPDFDPYGQLQIDPGASDEAIRSAYQRLARMYHPDLNPGIDSSRMERLNQAYAIVGDTERRHSYDLRHPLPLEADRNDPTRKKDTPADGPPPKTQGVAARASMKSSAAGDRECRHCHRVIPAGVPRCSLCGAA
jgi:curved DNA-binding protein CbpA